MKFKKLDTSHSDAKAKEVILQVRRTDNEDYVEITASHETEDESLLQSSEIRFEDFEDQHLAMERFINDYSSVSAVDFVESFKL